MSEEGTIRIWDLAQGGEPRVLRGHEGGVLSIAFAPDGRTLASVSEEGTIRLWDLAQGGEPRVLAGHANLVRSLAFAPDGRTLVSVSGDGTTRLWDLDLPRVRAKACEILSRNLSAEEWRRYFGAEPPIKTCAGRPIHASYFEAADELAKQGDLDGAVDAYRGVLSAFSTQELDPLARARRLAAPGIRDKAVALADNGNVQGALAAYAKAKALDPGLADNARVENALCWAGGLWGQATDVLGHCGRAVELAPDSAVKGSRGLARAQTGDLAGAVEDFRAFVTWAEASDDEEFRALIPKRRAWIDCLEQGKNPFDTAALEALRTEEP